MCCLFFPQLKQETGDLSIIVTEASALNPGGPCAVNGFKTWGGGLFGDKGYTCYCDVVKKPKMPCTIIVD